MNKRIRKKKEKQWEQCRRAFEAEFIEHFHRIAPLIGVQSETWLDYELQHADSGMNKIIYDIFVKPQART